jgi:histone arginine demethylase JMJD6
MSTTTIDPSSLTVDRKPGLSQNDFIANYLNKGIPVIIPGAMKEWGAHSRWNPLYFRDTLGDKMVKVAGKELLLRDFMDSVLASSESKPSHYLNEVNIHKDFPELLPDIDPHLSYGLPDRLMSKLLPEKWGFRQGVVELLIGGKGTKFPTLHYDGYHMNTFVTQIRGDKEFIFYPPDQTPFMYPEEKMYNRSLVNDVHEPDLKRFPLFANAKPIKVIVYEGETVFLPSGWWHTTRLLSLSIAVSTNNIAAQQWQGFIKDYVPGMSGSKLKQPLYKTYLAGTGMLMSLTGK